MLRRLLVFVSFEKSNASCVTTTAHLSSSRCRRISNERTRFYRFVKSCCRRRAAAAGRCYAGGLRFSRALLSALPINQLGLLQPDHALSDRNQGWPAQLLRLLSISARRGAGASESAG